MFQLLSEKLIECLTPDEWYFNESVWLHFFLQGKTLQLEIYLFILIFFGSLLPQLHSKQHLKIVNSNVRFTVRLS